LRDIPDEIEIIARDEANRQGIRFLTLLRKSALQSVSQPPVADNMKPRSRFSRFVGVWSDAKAAEFINVLLEQRSFNG
jgi:hypothetical protein